MQAITRPRILQLEVAQILHSQKKPDRMRQLQFDLKLIGHV